MKERKTCEPDRSKNVVSDLSAVGLKSLEARPPPPGEDSWLGLNTALLSSSSVPGESGALSGEEGLSRRGGGASRTGLDLSRSPATHFRPLGCLQFPHQADRGPVPYAVSFTSMGNLSMSVHRCLLGGKRRPLNELLGCRGGGEKAHPACPGRPA